MTNLLIIFLLLIEIVIVFVFYDKKNSFISILNIIIMTLLIIELILYFGLIFKLIQMNSEYLGYAGDFDVFLSYFCFVLLLFSLLIVFRLLYYLFYNFFNKNRNIISFDKTKVMHIAFVVFFIPLYFPITIFSLYLFYFISMNGYHLKTLEISLPGLIEIIEWNLFLYLIYLFLDSKNSINKKKVYFSIVLISFYGIIYFYYSLTLNDYYNLAIIQTYYYRLGIEINIILFVYFLIIKIIKTNNINYDLEKLCNP